MKAFLIAQTAINLLAAVTTKNTAGRISCLGFGLWGGAVLLLGYFAT